MDKFLDRHDAGKQLAGALRVYANRKDVLVLALPRGGVPVAYEVARALHLPLDVFIVRKLGVPGHEELAMGAIAMGGVAFFNDDILQELSINQADIQKVVEAESKELQRREIAYRGKIDFPSVSDKTIILVDDGIATGATMRAAIMALEKMDAARIVVAVPVADLLLTEIMSHEVDDLICLQRPFEFYSVGRWYEDFAQTEDEEVYALLKDARQ